MLQSSHSAALGLAVAMLLRGTHLVQAGAHPKPHTALTQQWHKRAQTAAIVGEIVRYYLHAAHPPEVVFLRFAWSDAPVWLLRHLAHDRLPVLAESRLVDKVIHDEDTEYIDRFTGRRGLRLTLEPFDARKRRSISIYGIVSWGFGLQMMGWYDLERRGRTWRFVRYRRWAQS